MGDSVLDPARRRRNKEINRELALGAAKRADADREAEWRATLDYIDSDPQLR